MKSKRSIKKRIEELKEERRLCCSQSAKSRHNGRIRDLEWVLDE